MPDFNDLGLFSHLDWRETSSSGASGRFRFCSAHFDRRANTAVALWSGTKQPELRSARPRRRGKVSTGFPLLNLQQFVCSDRASGTNNLDVFCLATDAKRVVNSLVVTNDAARCLCVFALFAQFCWTWRPNHLFYFSPSVICEMRPWKCRWSVSAPYWNNESLNSGCCCCWASHCNSCLAANAIWQQKGLNGNIARMWIILHMYRKNTKH